MQAVNAFAANQSEPCPIPDPPDFRLIGEDGESELLITVKRAE